MAENLIRKIEEKQKIVEKPSFKVGDTVRVLSYRECPADTGIFKTQHQAFIYLNTFGFSFNNFEVHLYGIAYSKGRFFDNLLFFFNLTN